MNQTFNRKIKSLAGFTVLAFIAALVFTFVFALIPHTVYADSSVQPQAISVCYYDGILTRGFTWRTDRTVNTGEVQIIEKTGSITKQNVNWSNSAVIKVTADFKDGLDGAAGGVPPQRIWKANYTFAANKTYFYLCHTNPIFH